MGIYSRSLAIIIIFLFVNEMQVFGQRSKKNKKDKGQIESTQVLLLTQIDSVSYALGMGMAKNLKTSGMDSLSYGPFQAGIKAVFNSDSTLISIDQVQLLLQSYFTELSLKATEKYLEEENAFLAENKLRPEVKTTESGLQYEVITQGEGPFPNANSQVTVNYEGKLLNGEIFDSSYERGEVIQFSLEQVIVGWTEGLQLMNPGSKYILYIPSELAWGERGAGEDIPPNSMVIFTVELISIDN